MEGINSDQKNESLENQAFEMATLGILPPWAAFLDLPQTPDKLHQVYPFFTSPNPRTQVNTHPWQLHHPKGWKTPPPQKKIMLPSTSVSFFPLNSPYSAL